MANDLDVRDFGGGFVPAATAPQNSDTLQAAIDSLQTNPNPGWTGAESGHTIWIPAGIWPMGKQIRIFRPVRLARICHREQVHRGSESAIVLL